MKSKKYFIYILLILFFIINCQVDAEYWHQEGGSLTGYVSVYFKNFHDRAYLPGSLVQIEGTNFSAVTDENGKWIINDVPAGVYTIKYSRENCLSKREYNVQAVGSGIFVLKTIILSPADDRTISNFTFSFSRNIFWAGGTLPSKIEDALVIGFFFTDSLEEIKPEMEFSYICYQGVNTENSNFETGFNDDFVAYHKMKRGKTYYVRAAVMPQTLWGSEILNPSTRKFEISTHGIKFTEPQKIVLQ